MKTKRITLLLLSLSLSSAIFATGAQARGPNGTSADYGSAVAATARTRVIALTDSTKYVNVNDGDTVRFVKGDASFTWNFATWPSKNIFKLSHIAPEAMHVENVEVYVGANPLYAD